MTKKILVFILQIAQPSVSLDSILRLDEAESGYNSLPGIVRNLNEPDVDLYVWISNDATAGYTGIARRGGACDNFNYWKSSLSRGPSRGVVETAEVI